MAANSYLDRIKSEKEKAYRDGMWDGINMGLNLVAIALHLHFGFGDGRITQLESKVQELIDEIIDTNDPYVTKVRIERAIKQIRGENYKEG